MSFRETRFSDELYQPSLSTMTRGYVVERMFAAAEDGGEMFAQSGAWRRSERQYIGRAFYWFLGVLFYFEVWENRMVMVGGCVLGEGMSY